METNQIEIQALKQQIDSLNGEFNMYGVLVIKIINALLDYTEELKTQRTLANDLYYKKEAEMNILRNDIKNTNIKGGYNG